MTSADHFGLPPDNRSKVSSVLGPHLCHFPMLGLDGFVLGNPWHLYSLFYQCLSQYR